MDLLAPGTRTEHTEAGAEAFDRHFTRSPAAIGWAPGRANLIGEHTDYNGGLCLPVALPHATFVSAAPRTDSRVRIVSEQQATRWEGDLDGTGPGRVAGWPAFVAGVIWALRLDGVALPGLDLSVDSSVPVGAGLASSAALSCATALAVTEIAGLELDEALRGRLVRACVRAETEVVRAPTGGLDQTVALQARADHALLLDFSTPTPGTRQVPLPLAKDGLQVLVVDTRVSHTLTDGGFAARRADCEAAAAALGVGSLHDVGPDDLDRLPDDRLLRRTRHVVSEQRRVREVVAALTARDYDTLGRCLVEGHHSLRDDFEVSCPELDTVVRAATDAGAVGARMTGGGFGGSAIVVVTDDLLEHVADQVVTAFVAADHRPPHLMLATPSERGGRISRTG